MKRIGFDIIAATDTGKTRKCNEDNYILRSGEFGNCEFCLLAIADGMGGMVDGDVASQIAIDRLAIWWDEELPFIIGDTNTFLNEAVSSLKKVVIEINWFIYDKNSINKKHSGTTLTIAIAAAGQYGILHVGDCRAYLLQHSYPHKMILLTKDHTWVRQQIIQGLLTEEQAKTHPDRGKLINGLGLWDSSFWISEYHGELKKGDVLFLCSDGFYAYVDEEQTEISIKNMRGVYKMAGALIATAQKTEAHDNITVALAQVCSRRVRRHK